MEIRKNLILQSPSGRPMLADVYWENNHELKPVLIFSHGFKGFKDWGLFNEMAERFAREGFVFIKFNFSHNGTTVNSPMEFEDLEAFGQNNFSIELDDLGEVIRSLFDGCFPVPFEQLDRERLYLLGHSRGGGITILKAGEDSRVKKIVTWASVNEFGKFWKKNQMDVIKERGVIYVENGRTKQQMPIYWQLYQNYFDHLDRLFIPDVIKRLQIPVLVVHGTADEAVPYSAAVEMKQWNEKLEVVTIENGNHVFGAAHPWLGKAWPSDFETVMQATIAFLKKER